MGRTCNVKQVKTISKKLEKNLAKTGCGECATSCQSACKTSCTVANQKCEKNSIEKDGSPPPAEGGNANG